MHPAVHLKVARIVGNCSTEIDRHARYADSVMRRSKNSLISVNHGLVANDATISNQNCCEHRVANGPLWQASEAEQ